MWDGEEGIRRSFPPGMVPDFGVSPYASERNKTGRWLVSLWPVNVYLDVPPHERLHDSKAVVSRGHETMR